MNKKKFYTHLVEVESLVVELNQMNLSDKEKMDLAQLVDSNLHHTVLDAILSELSEEDKRIFMEHLSQENSNEIWRLLNEKIDNIEDKIKNAAENLKKELHEDIKEAKDKK